LQDELKDHKPVIVVGDTARAKRDKAIADFQSGQTKCIIGNIAAMSEGVDLSAADTIVFVECTWSTSALEQASSRVENINKSGVPRHLHPDHQGPAWTIQSWPRSEEAQCGQSDYLKEAMSNPFEILEPTCISFSGGRTSAFMLAQGAEGSPDEPAI
jgi:hypothetical protein